MPGRQVSQELQQMNVVSVMAHQDDEMRCLGTLLKCRARGDRLHFITLTDGSKGFVQQPDIAREKAAAIRHREMSHLARQLDAQYICLGEPDEFLMDSPDVRIRLIEALRRTRADLVFTHYREDYNADHTTTHCLLLHCAMQACLPVLPTRSRPLREHPAVFCVEPHGAFAFPATYFVDITPFEARKIRLLKRHRSQEEAMQRAVKAGFDRLCRCPDAYWGQKVGCEFAEGFAPMQSRGAIKPYPVLP
jgi:LmbE family N-acetylglucosaminyl deacetylase